MTSLATKLKDYTPMTQLKMHGEMTLDMNQETMVKAAQLWVDDQFKYPVNVKAVIAKVSKAEDGTKENDFELILEPPAVL